MPNQIKMHENQISVRIYLGIYILLMNYCSKFRETVSTEFEYCYIRKYTLLYGNVLYYDFSFAKQ